MGLGGAGPGASRKDEVGRVFTALGQDEGEDLDSLSRTSHCVPAGPSVRHTPGRPVAS